MIASVAVGGRCRSGLAQGRTAFFFEPKSFASQEQPNHIVRDFDPARSQLVLQGVQCQMWRRAETLHDERSMRIQCWLAVPAHLAGRDGAGGAITLGPLHNRRNRNAKPRTATDRQLSPFETAVTTRLRRSLERGLTIRCWPPSPASILNHIRFRTGIPSDSITI